MVMLDNARNSGALSIVSNIKISKKENYFSHRVNIKIGRFKIFVWV